MQQGSEQGSTGRGRGEESQHGGKNIVRLQGRWIPAMSCIQVFHHRKPEREAMKEGQRVGQTCGTEAGSSCWLKYSQQLQSISAAGHLTAVVSLPRPGCSFQPLCRYRAPKVPSIAHAIPSPSCREGSARCPSLSLCVAHRVSPCHADPPRCPASISTPFAGSSLSAFPPWASMAHWLQTSPPVLGGQEPVPEREARGYIRHGGETEWHRSGLLPAVEDSPTACNQKAPIPCQSQGRRLRHATET